MKELSFVRTLLTSMMLLTSCNSDVDQTGPKAVNDSTAELSFIMRDNVTCKLDLKFFDISGAAFTGRWEDSITWRLEDSCWYGIEYLNKRITCVFKETGSFTWTETYDLDDLNNGIQGAYWTYSRNDSNFLILMYNEQGDTVFNQGDTGTGRTFLIYDSSKSGFRARKFNKEHFDIEVHEFKRIPKI